MARGKISLLVKRFPSSRRLHWKKKKALTALNNRKQWLREFDVTESAAYEIEMEHLSDYYLVTEASIPASPTYITTE